MNRNESPYLPLGRQGRIYEPLRGSEWTWTKRRCGRGFVENLLDPELIFFYNAIVILMYIYIPSISGLIFADSPHFPMRDWN